VIDTNLPPILNSYGVIAFVMSEIRNRYIFCYPCCV